MIAMHCAEHALQAFRAPPPLGAGPGRNPGSRKAALTVSLGGLGHTLDFAPRRKRERLRPSSDGRGVVSQTHAE